jgi:hypothetical protein
MLGLGNSISTSGGSFGPPSASSLGLTLFIQDGDIPASGIDATAQATTSFFDVRVNTNADKYTGTASDYVVTSITVENVTTGSGQIELLSSSLTMDSVQNPGGINLFYLLMDDVSPMDDIDAGSASGAAFAHSGSGSNSFTIRATVEVNGYAGSAVISTTLSLSDSDLLLDIYSGSAAAYSLRKIKRTYSGPAIRVREDGTDTEQDIGFDSNGNLDTTAILLFCLGNNGFVTKWYDQSGNAYDATQTTTGKQPKIYDSSTGVVTENGKPAIEFDGNDDSLPVGTIDVKTAFAVASADLASGNQPIFGAASGLVQFLRTQSDYDLYNNFGTMSVTGSPDQNSLIYALINGVSSELAVNGGTATTGQQSNDAFGNFTIGNERGSYYDGKQEEIVIYDSNQSTNRTGIETNMNDFYSIYTP